MKVFLSDCLYGMDLYKKYFSSERIEKVCMCNIIQYFIDIHSMGKTVGPIDVCKMQIDLETGNVVFPETETIDKMMKSVDTLKFLAPEILQERSRWTIYADNFLLAVLLFSVEYFAFPFDGKKIYEKPVLNIEYAKEIYCNPIFVFDACNPENQILEYNASRIIMNWNKSTTVIKDYYTTNFTDGISSFDIRTDARDVLVIFNYETKKDDFHILEINEKRFTLYEGLEIYERDIDSDCTGNEKLLVVIKSTKNNNILALGNTSDDTWSVYLPDSQEIMVLPKAVAPIVKGATISIGEYLANII